jgi:protein MpaA
MRISSRETPEGVDLNRDFLEAETIEVQTELKKLRQYEHLKSHSLLHEDWEANGFYLYELTEPDAPPRFGRRS